MPENERNNAWFQHDGAPPHRVAQVIIFFNNNFEDRWIANNGPFHWPARSPDLTPLDYFLWGTIKNRVYANPATTKEDMQTRLRQALQTIEPESISKATHSNFLKRVEKCLQVNGGHFEHLLKYN